MFLIYMHVLILVLVDENNKSETKECILNYNIFLSLYDNNKKLQYIF